MKYLRKFDSVSEMNTALASSEISILGLAYNNGTPVINNKKIIPPDPTIPFYVENITNSDETLSIRTVIRDKPFGFLIEKSTDGSTWSSLGTTGGTRLTETLAPGAKLYLRATTNEWCSMIYNAQTSIYGVSKVGGNIMSLLYGSSFTGNETTFPSDSMFNFSELFHDDEEANKNLVDASQLVLPATTLTRSCYKGMFESCMSLTAAPALPATTLASACYSEMFNNCTALTTAPALPATTLVVSCYAGMFNGCTSLTTAPALPATTLVRYCYIVMFNGCTNLNYIKCLATNISTEECTTNWTDGVAASGTFVKDPNMSTSTWGSGSNGIPSGWTVEDAQD